MSVRVGRNSDVKDDESQPMKERVGQQNEDSGGENLRQFHHFLLARSGVVCALSIKEAAATTTTTTMMMPAKNPTWLVTRAAVLFALLGACSAALKDIDKGKAGGAHIFKLGETVKLECKDWETGEWGKGPICKETGEEFAITFGYNNFVYCGMEIEDKKFYDNLVQIIKMEKTWQCRIPMNKRKDFYVPFTIPVWGVVEPDHVHIDNHLNYVLHVDKGNIVAATAYPVHDRFQFGKAGSLISMHGPVRFFDRGSYQSLAGSGSAYVTGGEGSFSPTVALALCSLTAAVTLFAAAVMYQRRLKPRLIKKLLKDK